MKCFTAEVVDQIGIHARPASIVISAASKFKSDLELKLSEEKKANLKSVMQVLSLAVQFGSKIQITANGVDEVEAIETLKAALVKNGLISLESIKDC